jgi:hypothetical protein
MPGLSGASISTLHCVIGRNLESSEKNNFILEFSKGNDFILDLLFN